MGRRENPIAQCDRELDKLARWLRAQRSREGLSYDQLHARLAAQSERSWCSTSTLIRAASGDQVPRLKTVLAYAWACDADQGEAERLWKRARYRAIRRNAEPAPHPRYVQNFAELRAALVDLYQRDGARPYRELEEASGCVLAHATVGRFLRQRGGRPTRQFVLAFAETCGVKGLALHEWGQAWDRAEEQRLGGTRAIAARRSSIIAKIGPKGGPVRVYSDPARTPDGQEVRRISLDVPPSLVEAAVAETWEYFSERFSEGFSQIMGQGAIEVARGQRRVRPPAVIPKKLSLYNRRQERDAAADARATSVGAEAGVR